MPNYHILAINTVKILCLIIQNKRQLSLTCPFFNLIHRQPYDYY